MAVKVKVLSVVALTESRLVLLIVKVRSLRFFAEQTAMGREHHAGITGYEDLKK